MGENITLHLEEVAFNTSRRPVRAALLQLLELSPKMKEVVDILWIVFFSSLFDGLYNLQIFWKPSTQVLGIPVNLRSCL